MRQRWWTHVIVVLLIGLIRTSVATAQVSVNAPPAEATTRSFDPSHPPAEMPPLSGDEAAVTSSKFSCAVKIEVTITTGDHPVMTISSVDATIGLKIIEWLPEGVSKKIHAHEDGHGQISGMSYAKGAEAAKKIGQKYLGKTFRLKSTDPKETQPLVQQAANEYTGEYFGAVEVPSQRAQEKYDQITDHGRNDVPESDAVKKALR